MTKSNCNRRLASLVVAMLLSAIMFVVDKISLAPVGSRRWMMGSPAAVHHALSSTTRMQGNDDFCETQGSLHNIALKMANYSSPPGSPSYNKARRILHSAQYFFIDCNDAIFDNVFQNIASMLQGFGLSAVPEETAQQHENRTVHVEVSFHGVKRHDRQPVTDEPRIILQTEQLVRLGGQYLPYLKACHESPHCFVLDFSDYHYQWAKDKGISDSFLLLPIMHQSRLGKYHNDDQAAVTFLPFSDRSLDVTFFGLMLKRRLQWQQQVFAMEKNWKLRIEKNMDMSYVKESYASSKVCPIIHAFSDQSAGEYHRLSELAPSGCIPVMETVADTLAIDIYSQCGGVIFASYGNITATVDHILQEINDSNIHSYPFVDNAADRSRWWSMGIRWSEILTTVFGNNSKNRNEPGASSEHKETTLVDRESLLTSQGSQYPLDQDTSIVVASSFIPTHPFIGMINATIHSAYKYLKGLSPTAPLVIAIDGMNANEPEWKHARLNGYIANMKEHFNLPHQTIVVTNYSVGLTASLKKAIDVVDTEFIYVIQHDMPFIRPIEHTTIIQTMKEYPDLLPLVRFNLYKNVPNTNKEKTHPVFVDHFGADSPVKDIHGIHFTKMVTWSDNNHLTRKSYYEELWPLFSTRGGFTGWKRPPEAIMMRDILLQDFPNCTRWCTHLYGPIGDEPYVGHFDGRHSINLVDYEAIILGENSSDILSANS